MLAKDLLLMFMKRSYRSSPCLSVVGSNMARPVTGCTSRPIFTSVPSSACPLWSHTVYRHGCAVINSKSRNMYQQSRFKGHAHWQNVAHTKKENNAKKSALQSVLYMKAVSAMKAGGPDPKLNKPLEDIIKQCASSSVVPKAMVQGWITKFIESKHQGPGYVELNGPKGIVFVIRTTSDSVNVKDNMNRMAKKLNILVAKVPRWTRLFDRKGVITVPVTKDMDVTNMDTYIEVALECGAEDVIVTENNEDIPDVDRVLKFHCDPERLDRVAQDIQETFDLEVYSQDVDITPHTFATLETEEESTYCQSLIDKMYTYEDVIKVFDNIALAEE